ncbi:hypothetical protein Emag_002426 [Eimeria magna]
MAIVRPGLRCMVVPRLEGNPLGRLSVLRRPIFTFDRYSRKSATGECGLLRWASSSRPSCCRHHAFESVPRASDVALCSSGSLKTGEYLHLHGFHAAAGSNGKSGHVLRVPPLGESITEGTVVKWLRGVGSIVQAEEVVCILETDKVSVDIHADIAGRLVSIAVDVGGTAFVGGDLAVIEPLSPDEAAQAALEPHLLEKPATSAPSVSRSPSSEPTATASSVSTTSCESVPRQGFRKPMILFRSVRNKLEKMGILPHHEGARPVSESTSPGKGEESASPARTPGIVNPRALIRQEPEEVPSFLGRPDLSAEEIEAINDGGVANLDEVARAWRVSLTFQPMPFLSRHGECDNVPRRKAQPDPRKTTDFVLQGIAFFGSAAAGEFSFDEIRATASANVGGSFSLIEQK